MSFLISWIVSKINDSSTEFLTSDNPLTYAAVAGTRRPYGIESAGVGLSFPLSPRLLIAFQPKLLPRVDEIRVARITHYQVRYFNTLQTAFATAQVYSASGNFDLVREAVATEPDLADPARNRVLINGRPADLGQGDG